jgi:hypothetical protein
MLGLRLESRVSRLSPHSGLPLRKFGIPEILGVLSPTGYLIQADSTCKCGHVATSLDEYFDEMLCHAASSPCQLSRATMGRVPCFSLAEPDFWSNRIQRIQG